MKNVSNFALEDNRLKIIIGDAVKYIMNTKETYDLIVEDMYLEITTIKQKTDYNLLKNCITKTKVLSSKDDIKKILGSNIYRIANKNIFTKNIILQKMKGNKVKSLLGLGYEYKEIQKLDDYLLNNINIYITSYFCKPVYLYKKKYTYGYESYGNIENKLLNS